jgi:hypothetical protein
MNTERILHIADMIEKLEPRQFDMSDYVTENECGTVACIAGWTYLTYGDPAGEGDPHELAAIHLGLDEDRADDLFLPNPLTSGLPSCVTYAQITPAHAAQTLRKLAATGEVDWSHANRVR